MGSVRGVRGKDRLRSSGVHGTGSPVRPAPKVDWEQVWRAGDGAPSDEAAIGRIIRAAAVVARTIALRTPEATDLHSGSDGEVTPPARGRGAAAGDGVSVSSWNRQPDRSPTGGQGAMTTG